MYATWKKLPTVSLNSHSRCTSSGIETPGGEYAQWSVDYTVEDNTRYSGGTVVLTTKKTYNGVVTINTYTHNMVSESDTVIFGPIDLGLRPDAVLDYTITVTDNEDYVTEIKTGKELMPDVVSGYFKPTFGGPTIFRCDSTGAFSDDDQYMHLDIPWTVSGIKDATATDITAPSSLRIQVSQGSTSVYDNTITSFSGQTVSTDMVNGLVSLTIGNGQIDTDKQIGRAHV